MNRDSPESGSSATMPMNNTLAEFFTRQKPLIEAGLNNHLPNSSVPGAEKLNDALRYALFPGGRRWRPIFTLLGASLTAPTKSTFDIDAISVACAVEFLHNSSLIFDDLPSMDSADRRRGKAALHLVFGEDAAILAALALLNQSFTLFADIASPAAAQKLVLQASRCIGSNGMIGGQAADLHGGQSDSCTLHTGGRNLKTTALTKLMMTGGAIASNAADDEVAALARFGECLGLAYQIYDDLLDVCDEEVVSGKTAHQDARLSRPSAVTDLGIGGSVKLARDTIEEGVAVLQSIFENRPALEIIVSAAQYLFRDLEKYDYPSRLEAADHQYQIA